MFSEMLTGRVEESDPRAEMGRFGDNRMAHVEDGEMIIPQRVLASSPGLRELLLGAFEENGLNPDEFMVGSEESKTNPMTGEDEYFDPLTAMAISGGVSALGGILDRKDNKKANAAMQAGLQQAQKQLSPYSKIGLQGMQDYSSRLGDGFNYDDYKNSEGYDFALNEGLRAMDARLGAAGMSKSGKAVKEAAKYAQGLASQDYGDAYSRWLANNSQFANLGGMGLGAAQGIAGLQSQAGQTQAQSHMANASNRNQLLGGLMNMAGTMYQPRFSSMLIGQ
jgi:hypothetical protein